MSFKEKLSQFKALLDVVRGKEDVREQLSWLFQPSNPKSASNLTANQAEFVEDANFVTDYFPRFKPLRDLADEILITTPSIKGRRVEDAINYQKASKGATGTQVGIFQGMREKLSRKDGKEKVE